MKSMYRQQWKIQTCFTCKGGCTLRILRRVQMIKWLSWAFPVGCWPERLQPEVVELAHFHTSLRSPVVPYNVIAWTLSLALFA